MTNWQTARYQCAVKPTRTHNAPCGCETPGTLHNHSYRVEQAHQTKPKGN